MIKQIKSKKAFRFYARLLSLLVMTSLLITSSATAIAIDSYRDAHSLSEQTFTLTPEEGVTVTLNGLLPTNGTAEAAPAEAAGEGVLHAYDITIRYAGGEEFEPADDAPIHVGFESAAIAEALANAGTALTVEHITDSGEVEPIDLTLAEEDTAEFVAGSFSIYLIRANPEAPLTTPRKTFWFLDSQWSDYNGSSSDPEHLQGAYYVSGLYRFPNTAGEMVSTQIVKDGEKLHPIVMPENYDWGSFYGWYIVELDFEKSAAATAAATGQPVASITELADLTQFVYEWEDNPTLINADSPISVTEDHDTDVFLAPYYSRYRFVNFREHERVGEEASNIVARKLLVLGNNNSDTIDISDVTADSPDVQSKVFYGWKYQGRTYQTRRATGDVIQQTITVTRADLGENESVDVYAVFKDAAWLYFVHGDNNSNAQYVPAMFSFLYDPEVPENERTCIEQLPTSTRPGYIFDGWYTGHMEGDQIVYEQQVSMPLVDASVVGNSSIITTDGRRIDIGTNGTYIKMGKLYLQEEMTLYAKWRPEKSADCKVVIWKQKVTDRKNATDSQKTYDYHDYVLIEDQPSGSVVLDSYAYRQHDFEDLKDSADSETAAEFVGFHYSRTEVVVNGHTYNGDIPSERVKGVVAPDGSTVVNVYYDRDLMAINFYYTNDTYAANAAAGAVADSYRYSEATASSTELFGLVNDNYVPLTKTTTPEQYYVYRWEYFPADDFEDDRYAIIGNEYVPLDVEQTYTWMQTGGYYVPFTGTPSSNKTYKGIVNGNFVNLTYSNSRWYYNGNTRYRATVYEPKTDGEKTEYTGSTRYILSGSSVTATTNITPTIQYEQAANGTLYELQRVADDATYFYNGTEYTGQRYARTEFQRIPYEGETRYKKTANGFEPTTDETGTLYGRESATAPYEEIIKKTETVITYTYTENGTEKPYNGTVFTRTNQNYKKRLTWTGLYGQTIGQNGYSWTSVAGISWYDSEHSSSGSQGITQTLLDDFGMPYYPYNLYTNGNLNTAKEIRHYKQLLNPDDTLGGYGDVDADAYITYSSTNNNSINFQFTNKFTSGFVVNAYTTGSGNFSPAGNGAHVEPYQSESVGFPLYVYHARKTHTVTMFDYRTENNSPGQPKDQEVFNVPYEAHISSYVQDYLTPPERTNYTFAGWYLDQAFTQRANIDSITMPDENLGLYAKWDLKYFFVEIDPNGGEMEDQLEFAQYTGNTTEHKTSTYTWLRYGTKLAEYANVERTYVPDNNGTYVYVNVKFAPTFEQAKNKNWDLCLPSKFRAAFYCLESELRTVYNEHFAQALDDNDQPLLSWEDFNAYCVDSSHKYRKAQSNEGYTLVAWYKVNDDGTTSNEIYNFNDIVTKPTRIRAVWRKTGEYYIEYDPYMRRYNIGEYVTKNGEVYHNPTHYDPFDPDDPTQITDKYLDSSTVTIRPAPEHITEYYVFKGWQLLYPDGTVVDTGPYAEPLAPGHSFTITSDYADSDGKIRFEACYEPENISARRVDTAALILDANTGVVQKNGLDIHPENKIYVDLGANQVRFNDQPNNFEVQLEDYYDNFLHEDGYVLIGWDKTPNPAGYKPEFAADAIIGVDAFEDENEHNILYAIWEPMYYLTLENHSTEYSVIFNLEFTGNGEGNHGLVYCNAEEGEDPYDRHLLSDCTHDRFRVKKVADNRFTIIMTPAADADHPNSETLVLPEGASAHYIVSGQIISPSTALTDSTCTLADTGVVSNENNNNLKTNGDQISIYNSGGASERLTPYNYYSSTRYKSLTNQSNNANVTTYSVTGPMKLGAEGQKVAFYTNTNPETSVYIAAGVYVPDYQGGKWLVETPDGFYDTNAETAVQISGVTGPDASLNFVDVTLTSPHYETTDTEKGITGLDIIQGDNKTYGISETYEKTTAYKFIGWYDELGAAPSDVPVDGEGTPPNETIGGLTVPNQSFKYYYALYVPLADGELTINHNEKQSSIGYPKKMLVQAVYPDENNVQQTATDSVTTQITSIAARQGHKEQTAVTFFVRESDADKSITVTLGAMSGYGSVYGNTYFEGVSMLSKTENTDAHQFVEGNVVAVVYYDPTQSNMEPYDPNLPVGNGETKHLYKHVLTMKIGDLFEDSETVKGYKVLRDLTYESDFTRKYEFIYNYKFRDGTTQRRYSENGDTSVYTTDEAFKDFVAESAPYITNFGEELIWDYTSIKIDNLLGKGRIVANMDAIQNPKKARVIVKTQGSGVEIPRQVDIGSTFPADKLPTAELIRSDGTQFYRWEITNTLTKEVIGYCYWHEFTFMVWQDITITAQYVPLKADGEYHRYLPDDEKSRYITIQHLDSTRNRWVKLDEDEQIIRTEKDLPAQYYDNLIDDFSILYIDHGLRINNHPEDYKVGLIYEVVGEITSEDTPEAYSTAPNDSLRLQAVNYLLSHSDLETGAINY